METRTKALLGFTLFGITWWAINRGPKVKFSFIPAMTTPPYAPAMVTYTMSVSGVILKGAKALTDLEPTVIEKEGFTFTIMIENDADVENDGQWVTFWITRTGAGEALLTQGYNIPSEFIQQAV